MASCVYKTCKNLPFISSLLFSVTHRKPFCPLHLSNKKFICHSRPWGNCNSLYTSYETLSSSVHVPMIFITFYSIKLTMQLFYASNNLKKSHICFLLIKVMHENVNAYKRVQIVVQITFVTFQETQQQSEIKSKFNLSISSSYAYLWIHSPHWINY